MNAIVTVVAIVKQVALVVTVADPGHPERASADQPTPELTAVDLLAAMDLAIPECGAHAYMVIACPPQIWRLPNSWISVIPSGSDG